MIRIFLDTETTGLEPQEGHRVVEIAAVAYEDREPIDENNGGKYHQYINPERDIPPGAFSVHGLSADFLGKKPVFADIADDFIEFVRGRELIMHNAPFDRSFLNAELKLLGKPSLDEVAAGITCSLEWSRKNNYQISAHNLNALCRHYGVDIGERAEYHSALLDVRLLGEVYFRMRQQQTEIDMPVPALQIATGDSQIIVKPASAEELAAHEALLAQMQEETNVVPLYKHQPPSQES